MNYIYLEIIEGTDSGKTFCLNEGANTLGRNPLNTIIINPLERVVSNHHAVIYNTPGQLYFQDLKSTNGSYLNDQKRADGVLTHQDPLRFGRNGLCFRILILETELMPPALKQQTKMSLPCTPHSINREMLHSRDEKDCSDLKSSFSSKIINQKEYTFLYYKISVTSPHCQCPSIAESRRS